VPIEEVSDIEAQPQQNNVKDEADEKVHATDSAYSD